MELPDQDYLFFRKRITWVVSLGILVVFIFASPVINRLNELNLNIHIPGEIGETISQVDKESNEYSMSILFTNNWSVFFTNLLVIGFLPALGEELFFRAVIVRLFTKMFKNIHVAVWIGALFFSLYHFQFAGSIPRVFMGALLGYVFIITGNIWYSVLLHFLNNAFIVVLVFMQAKGLMVENISNFGSKDWAIIVAIFSLMVLVFWGIYRWRKARHYQMESELLYR
jgi:membrane protease YdiL (CAAX protease family)